MRVTQWVMPGPVAVTSTEHLVRATSRLRINAVPFKLLEFVQSRPSLLFALFIPRQHFET